MTWLLSLVVSFLGGVAGCGLAILIASICVSWYRISSFEGGSGYFVIFMGLIGIVVGLIVALVAARWVAGGVDPGFLKALGVAMGSLGGLGLVILALCWLGADLAPKLDGKNLELAIEVRTPVGFALPKLASEHDAYAYLRLPNGRGQSSSRLRFEEARSDGGRLVVPATIPLQTSSANKIIQTHFDDETQPMISARLRGHPKRQDLEWSEWYESGWVSSKPRPAPNQAFYIRYRVQLVEEKVVPPEPSYAEIEAARLAAEQAEFDGLPKDAPITAWFKYTAYGTPPERLSAAVTAITARPQFVAELSSLILSDDREQAQAALSLFQHLPAIPPELAEPVATFGRKIASNITRFNATTPEQDPHYQAAADLSVDFNAWMTAVRALQAQGRGDCAAELTSILELARLRPDSESLRRDVVRVASYYLHEWTGLAPLPSDPPPR